MFTFSKSKNSPSSDQPAEWYVLYVELECLLFSFSDIVRILVFLLHMTVCVNPGRNSFHVIDHLETDSITKALTRV